jgi:hypothetical protein
MAQIYQFYAELDDCRSKIWRRFQVSNDITVAQLGYTVQTLFEMKAYHLMALEGAGKNESINRYEIPTTEFEPFIDQHREVKVLDATRSLLGKAVSKPGQKLNFNYDFGDDWWVSLTLEKVIDLPFLLDGAGFGIVEDCGGIHGLRELVDAFKKKSGEDGEFDITAFDIDDLNYRLKLIPKIYQQVYESNCEPSQSSLDLIDRKYQKKRKKVDSTEPTPLIIIAHGAKQSSK